MADVEILEDDVSLFDELSADEQERAEYLNEVVQHSTQFGLGNWNYEGDFSFNSNY